jgi:hypothetical protein
MLAYMNGPTGCCLVDESRARIPIAPSRILIAEEDFSF